MIANIGLLLGLGVLIALALRGTNILIAALTGSVIVALTNDITVPQALTEHWPFGPLGAFTFAGNFFILFLAGAVFGKTMAESKAAPSIAAAMARKLGAIRALWIIVISTAVLTYGGVVVFVVIFTVYPLGLALIQAADIPKRLLAGAAALGAGTFTMSALPGAPSVQNVISATALDTSLFAGAGIGIIGGVIMFALGIWYLERERVRAAASGDGFEAGPRDIIPEGGLEDPEMPSWKLAIVPLAVVLGTIILPRLLLLMLGDGIEPDGAWWHRTILFANAQPVLWPSLALLLGSLSALVLFPLLWERPMATLGRGADDAVMPLLNTAVVIGFGGVVSQTEGFTNFSELMLGSGLPPLLSAVVSVSIVAAIVGSASGGLQIFMQTLAEHYVEMGVDPEVLHRVVTMASGGIDSLPHCGAVIATLTIMQLTHRQAYKDIGVITVVIPVIATLAVTGLAVLMGS